MNEGPNNSRAALVVTNFIKEAGFTLTSARWLKRGAPADLPRASSSTGSTSTLKASRGNLLRASAAETSAGKSLGGAPHAIPRQSH